MLLLHLTSLHQYLLWSTAWTMQLKQHFLSASMTLESPRLNPGIACLVESLAVYFAVQNFRNALECLPFMMFTDNKSPVYAWQRASGRYSPSRTYQLYPVPQLAADIPVADNPDSDALPCIQRFCVSLLTTVNLDAMSQAQVTDPDVDQLR